MHQRHGRLHRQGSSRNSGALPHAVALSAGGRALSRLGQLTVGSNASLRVDAPEQTFIRGRNSWIGLGENELRLPAQGRAQVRIIRIKAIGFLNQ
jgi:hypothetical protein